MQVYHLPFLWGCGGVEGGVNFEKTSTDHCLCNSEAAACT